MIKIHSIQFVVGPLRSFVVSKDQNSKLIPVIRFDNFTILAQAEQYFKRVESDSTTYEEGRLKESYIETLKQLALARGNYKYALKYGKQHLEYKKSSVTCIK